jgi:F0F1-type ATP synthase assembly protein I
MKSPDPSSSSKKQQLVFMRDLASAMEMPFILVCGILVGGVIGFFLDRAAHTKPWFLLLFGMAGFGIGVWRVIRDLDRQEKKGGNSGG